MHVNIHEMASLSNRQRRRIRASLAKRLVERNIKRKRLESSIQSEDVDSEDEERTVTHSLDQSVHSSATVSVSTEYPSTARDLQFGIEGRSRAGYILSF